MFTVAMHADELEINPGLVRRLVERDAPSLADRLLIPLDAFGSSNLLFRLGSDHVVRIPRQPGGGRQILIEASWVHTLAPTLPVSVPEVVTVGQPGFGYPERWSVTRWINGVPPETPVTDGPNADQLARDLANFIKILHGLPVPSDAIADPSLRAYRAGPLSAVDVGIRKYIDTCRSLSGLALDLDDCLAVWTEGVDSAAPAEPAGWVHCDLLGENLLLAGGQLAAVLDFGGLAVGDPSVDLIVAWEVLGPRARSVFRSGVGCSDEAWQRGRAWAIAIAVMTFAYYWESMPKRCLARLAMARQVLRDEKPGI
jgi:aminoglycoside phosphotransferase (APT) family kinase protein